MLYDFECETCGAQLIDEFYHSRDNVPFSVLCECGGTMKRLFGLPHFIGWERTNPFMDVGRPATAEDDLKRCEHLTGTGRYETPGSNPDPRGEPLREYYRKKGRKRKVL